MDTFAALLQTRPVVFFHLVTAIAALLLGIVILTRRKGTGNHRTLGWAWVLLMGSTALASAFIQGGGLPNIAGFSPIHLFTVITGVGLPYAVWSARRGNIVAHRMTMRMIYIGGCIVAGMFTLLPGRLLGNLLWQQTLGLTA
jgi:uncharacterized membrane protein